LQQGQPPSPTIPSSSPTAPSKTATAKPAGDASASPGPMTPGQGSPCSWTWCRSSGTAASSCSSRMSRMMPTSSSGGGRRRERGEGRRAVDLGVSAAAGIRSFPAAPMRWENGSLSGRLLTGYERSIAPTQLPALLTLSGPACGVRCPTHGRESCRQSAGRACARDAARPGPEHLRQRTYVGAVSASVVESALVLQFGKLS